MPLTNSKIIQQTKEIRKVQTSAFNIKINDVEAARLKGGGEGAQQRSRLTFSILPFQIKGQINDLNLSGGQEGRGITLATCHKRLTPRTLTIKEQPMNERSLCFQRPKIELNLFSITFQLSSSTEARPFEKKTPRIRILVTHLRPKG